MAFEDLSARPPQEDPNLLNQGSAPGEQSALDSLQTESETVAELDANPFVKFWKHGGLIDFDRLRPGDFSRAVDHCVAESLRTFERLGDPTQPRTFAALAAPFEEVSALSNTLFINALIFERVMATDEWREDIAQAIAKLDELNTSMFLRRDLFEAFSALANSAEFIQLAPTQQRYVTLMVRDFKASGAALSDEAQAEVVRLDAEMGRLSKEFSANLSKARKEFALEITDAARLAGIPDDVVARAQRGEGDSRTWVLTADLIQQVLPYAHDPEVRSRMMDCKYCLCAEGEFDNREIVRELLLNRRRIAQIMGYANYAKKQMEGRAVESPEEMEPILQKLLASIRPAAALEFAALWELRRTREGPDAEKPRFCDQEYYANLSRPQEVDQAALRPYFELTHTVQQCLTLMGEMFGLEFEEVSNVPTWHPDVRTFRVSDVGSEDTRAYLYLDLFADPARKESGAATGGLYVGRPGEAHHVVVYTNYMKPEAGSPALITHKQMAHELWHELGHALHNMCSDVEIRPLAGANVPTDFVETYSQFLEELGYSAEFLQRVAVHHETGQTLPDETIQALIRLRTFRTASAALHTTALAMLDLVLHTIYDPEHDGDIVEYSKKFVGGFYPAELPENYALPTVLTHLFSPGTAYAGGYYAYIFSQLPAAQILERFEQAGIFDPQVSGELRRKILSRGNSIPPLDAFRDFVGSTIDEAAWLKVNGLSAPTAASA